MLRIKQGVDLKELEKFGFCYLPAKDKYQWSAQNKEDCFFFVEVYGDNSKLLMGEERVFYVNNCDDMDRINALLDLIFELIQAGLVEKVDE